MCRIALPGRFGPVLAAFLLAACYEVTVAPHPALEITLGVDASTGEVGRDFAFAYEAAGGSLAGIILDYGDGALDSIPTHGAQTAAGRRTHAYAQPGRYQVVALLEDYSGRSAADTAEVLVVVPGGGAVGPASPNPLEGARDDVVDILVERILSWENRSGSITGAVGPRPGRSTFTRAVQAVPEFSATGPEEWP